MLILRIMPLFLRFWKFKGILLELKDCRKFFYSNIIIYLTKITGKRATNRRNKEENRTKNIENEGTV